MLTKIITVLLLFQVWFGGTRISTSAKPERDRIVFIWRNSWTKPCSTRLFKSSTAPDGYFGMIVEVPCVEGIEEVEYVDDNVLPDTAYYYYSVGCFIAPEEPCRELYRTETTLVRTKR